MNNRLPEFVRSRLRELGFIADGEGLSYGGMQLRVSRIPDSNSWQLGFPEDWEEIYFAGMICRSGNSWYLWSNPGAWLTGGCPNLNAETGCKKLICRHQQDGL